MPRLVRRPPLLERIKAYLNPLDFLLWLSEEVDSNDWDEFHREYSTPIGVAFNLVFLIARANGGVGRRGSGGGMDDVFGDDGGRPGRGASWLGWFASFVVHALAFFSLLNASYTFFRRRHYRLFESPVDVTPSTPSAHRVRVDSSPISSSPLRFLSSMINSSTAESRAHPDPNMDVWELAVWDPLPICLRWFCLFSPGHVLVYWLFLPTTASDPRPSTTILTAMVLGGLLTAQLSMLQRSFSQQNKDTAVIHKEVLNEYDTKFVHPRTNPPVRDVGIQYDADEDVDDNEDGHVDRSRTRRKRRSPLRFIHTYTPTTIVHRAFQTNPNPNYAKHYDPDCVINDNTKSVHHRQHHPFRHQASALLRTPNCNGNDLSSPVRRPVMRQPHFQSSNPSSGSTTTTSTTTTKPTGAAGAVATATASGSSNVGHISGDGGSLGVYSHANSPLKRSAHHQPHYQHRNHHNPSSGAATTPINRGHTTTATGTRISGAGVVGGGGGGIKREGSPLKRSTLPPQSSTFDFPSSSPPPSFPSSSSSSSSLPPPVIPWSATNGAPTTTATTSYHHNGLHPYRPTRRRDTDL